MPQKTALIIRHVPHEGVAGYREPIEAAGYHVLRHGQPRHHGVAVLARHHVPVEVRTAVGNFASNLREPVTLVNDLLQGNTTRAWATTQRFVVNSTVGSFSGMTDALEMTAWP